MKETPRVWFRAIGFKTRKWRNSTTVLFVAFLILMAYLVNMLLAAVPIGMTKLVIADDYAISYSREADDEGYIALIIFRMLNRRPDNIRFELTDCELDGEYVYVIPKGFHRVRPWLLPYDLVGFSQTPDYYMGGDSEPPRQNLTDDELSQKLQIPDDELGINGIVTVYGHKGEVLGRHFFNIPVKK